MYFRECFEPLFFFCDSTCSHFWISEKFVKRLKLQGPLTTLTVQSKNYQQKIHTQRTEHKLTPVQSSKSPATFIMEPYLREDLNIGTYIIDVTQLKQHYPHLELVTLIKYSYADVEMMLDQNAFRLIHPLVYLKTNRQDTLVNLRLPLGRVKNEPLLLTSGLVSICLKALVRADDDS